MEINERLGNEHGAAGTHHQLGIVAQLRRQFEQAEQSYKKSLEINERLGNEHGAASTYHQLGIVAQQRQQFDDATGRLIQAGQRFVKFNDPQNCRKTMFVYLRVSREQMNTTDRVKLALRWVEAGLPEIPDEVFQAAEESK